MSHAPDADELLQILDDEDAGTGSSDATQPWRVLVVDDEPDIYTATVFGLGNAEIDGRPLTLLQASSAREAEAMVARDPEIATLLLDVVMETPDAGLRLVERIRAMNDRQALRIILRTGQPGYAPELEVIKRYDINDYKTKSELNQTRLLSSLTVALRGYAQLRRIEAHQRGLEKVVAASGQLLRSRGSLAGFAAGVLEQVNTILDHPPEGLVLLHHDGSAAQVLAASGSHAALAGQGEDQLPPALQQALAAAPQDGLLRHGPHAVLRVRASDGDSLLLLFEAGSSSDQVLQRLLELFAVNVSLGLDSLKVFHELDHHAHHDRETGLPNRAGLKRRVGQPARQRIGQVEVGELHEIRGILGEQVAARALGDLGQRLSQSLGEAGMVARIHGDRFVLAVDEAAASALEPLLLHTLAQPLRVGELSLQLPMALGWSSGADTLDQAIDEAGLVAAHLPPGRQVRSASFSSALQAQVRERLDLLADLPAALAQGRISLWLQPQVRLADRAVIGAEALARWLRPDGSMAGPASFIPLLEHTGSVVALGRYMLEQALDQLRSWPVPEHHIAVNLSVRQLEESDFAAWLIAACDAAGVARRRLRLEVTESAFALDGDRVGQALAELAAAGFALSIDDFGTGQSSLGRLAEIQVQELKLDRSLVRGIEGDSRARRVARLIVELGRDLGVEVLAEGIETEGQLAVLRELGCAWGQGWLFGRAMPPQQLRALLGEAPD